MQTALLDIELLVQTSRPFLYAVRSNLGSKHNLRSWVKLWASLACELASSKGRGSLCHELDNASNCPRLDNLRGDPFVDCAEAVRSCFQIQWQSLALRHPLAGEMSATRCFVLLVLLFLPVSLAEEEFVGPDGHFDLNALSRWKRGNTTPCPDDVVTTKAPTPTTLSPLTALLNGLAAQQAATTLSQTRQASCTFDLLQAVNFLARLAFATHTIAKSSTQLGFGGIKGDHLTAGRISSSSTSAFCLAF